MPVLTYDITFGTKKVKLLNISHNYVNDIRKGKFNSFLSLYIDKENTIIIELEFKNLINFFIYQNTNYRYHW